MNKGSDAPLLGDFERLLDARRTIISVVASQRGEMTDLAVIALQDVAIELGDIVFNARFRALTNSQDGDEK